MLLAAQFTAAMKLKSPISFTDYCSLARVVAALGAKDPVMIWEIRR
jgi:hypothetical protein